MENETKKIINKTEKANSHEFGKASNRFKLYFETAEDLKAQIESLRAFGYLNEEE